MVISNHNLKKPSSISLFSLIPKRNAFRSYLSNKIAMIVWFPVPTISISMHPIFLFRQWDRECMRERSYHFKFPSILLFIEYHMEFKLSKKSKILCIFLRSVKMKRYILTFPIDRKEKTNYK